MADPALFLRRLRKKVLKRYVQNVFFPGWRPRLLRWCGYVVGDDVYIADGLVVIDELSESGNLTIGDRVSIAPRVTLVTSSHPNNSRISTVLPGARGPIEIGADAWIGAGAVVLPGVRIGRGAVVGASSVVTRDVAELQVVAGQPAAVIRTLPTPENWS